MVDIYGLGIRDAILLFAGITSVYLVYLWLKLMQVKKREKKPQKPPSKRIREENIERPISSSYPATESEDDDAAIVYERPRTLRSVPSSGQPSEPDSQAFERSLNQSQQRLQQAQTAELEHLRTEVVTLRQSLAEMKDEVDRLKAANTVSPLYSEAVGMAQHGLNAEGIAARCGISIAEAELVAALVNKPNNDFADPLDGEYHETAARYAA